MNFAFYLHDEKSSEQFEKKLLWLKSRYNLISIRDLREHIYGKRTLHNACMISVDDGWLSTYRFIYPVMKKYNVPFTVFVSPHVMETGMNFWYYTLRYCNEEDIKQILIKRNIFSDDIMKFPAELALKEIGIDEVYDVLDEYLKAHPEIMIPRGFMNTYEVLELHNSGLVEVGAHTMLHPILKLEEGERSRAEIVQSVEKLSELLNCQVSSFAYPNGIENVDYGERDMNFAKTVGIDMAFSVNPNVIDSNTNPLSIPRWGSQARLRFGRWGIYLPSRANQRKIRENILKYKL